MTSWSNVRIKQNDVQPKKDPDNLLKIARRDSALQEQFQKQEKAEHIS